MAPKKKVEAAEAPAKDSGSVTVTWRGGERVYSKELHGADYKKLAAEFAEKKNGSM